jgi:uncharacterized membrane protein
MINVEVSTVINQPVGEVFDFLSNMENNMKWRTSQQEVKKLSEGPIGVGTTYRMVNHVLGRQLETKAEVIEYEHNRKFMTSDKSGTLPVEAQRIFEAVEGGTRVTFILRADPSGVFKIAAPLFASMAKRSIESDVANLKDLMEAGILVSA